VHKTASVPEGIFIATSVVVGPRVKIGDGAKIDWSLLFTDYAKWAHKIEVYQLTDDDLLVHMNPIGSQLYEGTD
jgi:hypothetical protein